MSARILLALVLACSSTAAMAQLPERRSFYDERGNYRGSSVRWDNRTNFYDGRGSFAGNSTRSGNSTNFYGRRGNYLGTVKNTSPLR